MKLAVAVDPGKDGSVRITISCHYKDHFANSYFLHNQYVPWPGTVSMALPHE